MWRQVFGWDVDLHPRERVRAVALTPYELGYGEEGHGRFHIAGGTLGSVVGVYKPYDAYYILWDGYPVPQDLPSPQRLRDEAGVFYDEASFEFAMDEYEHNAWIVEANGVELV